MSDLPLALARLANRDCPARAPRCHAAAYIFQRVQARLAKQLNVTVKYGA